MAGGLNFHDMQAIVAHPRDAEAELFIRSLQRLGARVIASGLLQAQLIERPIFSSAASSPPFAPYSKLQRQLQGSRS